MEVGKIWDSKVDNMNAGVVCLIFGSNVAKRDKEIACVKSE
jgi:hypothetical protein